MNYILSAIYAVGAVIHFGYWAHDDKFDATEFSDAFLLVLGCIAWIFCLLYKLGGWLRKKL